MKGWREDGQATPYSEWEHRRRRETRRRRLLGYATIAIGALVVAIGVWALIVLLIGVYG